MLKPIVGHCSRLHYLLRFFWESSAMVEAVYGDAHRNCIDTSVLLYSKEVTRSIWRQKTRPSRDLIQYVQRS